MLHCSNCGYEIQEESKFCPACGSPVKIAAKQEDGYPNPVEQYNPFTQKDPFGTPVQKQDSFSQPDPFESAAFNNRQNSYNLFRQSYGPPVSSVKKEKHITFIFVTALIFMIIFISRSLSTLIAIPDLQELKSYIQNVYIAGILNMLCTYIVCAALVVFFIFAVNSRNTGKDIQKRLRFSEILYIFSITIFLLEIVYLASEIYYAVAAVPYTDGWLSSGLITIFFTHPAFIIFFIINIVKSHAFRMELKQKIQNADILSENNL